MRPDWRGLGKTVIFAAIAKKHIDLEGKVLIFTHRKELLSQTGDKLYNDFGLLPEFITAGSSPDLSRNLHVSMVETFSRRKEKYRGFLQSRTMIIIDEAHLNSFTKLFEFFPEDCFIVGATATPYRKGATVPALSGFYTDLIQQVDTPGLIRDGYLSPAITYGVEIDLSAAKKVGDDYDVSGFYEQNRIWEGVVQNWKKHTPGTKTLLFSSNVKNSKRVCQEFNAHGHEARHLEAETPAHERKDILAWFSQAPGAIVCNCGILTAGFDQPDIETIILYRATTSLPLYLQMCGRGSRIHPGKEHFNILDFGNHASRLGFWQKPRRWSLEKDEIRSRKKGQFPVKECPACFALVHAAAQVCEHCGHRFEPSRKEKKFAELQKLTYQQIQDEVRTADFHKLHAIQQARGYKKAWVYYQLKTYQDLERYARWMNYHPRWVDYQWQKRQKQRYSRSA